VLRSRPLATDGERRRRRRRRRRRHTGRRRRGRERRGCHRRVLTRHRGASGGGGGGRLRRRPLCLCSAPTGAVGAATPPRRRRAAVPGRGSGGWRLAPPLRRRRLPLPPLRAGVRRCWSGAPPRVAAWPPQKPATAAVRGRSATPACPRRLRRPLERSASGVEGCGRRGAAAVGCPRCPSGRRGRPSRPTGAQRASFRAASSAAGGGAAGDGGGSAAEGGLTRLAEQTAVLERQFCTRTASPARLLVLFLLFSVCPWRVPRLTVWGGKLRGCSLRAVPFFNEKHTVHRTFTAADPAEWETTVAKVERACFSPRQSRRRGTGWGKATRTRTRSAFFPAGPQGSETGEDDGCADPPQFSFLRVRCHAQRR